MRKKLQLIAQTLMSEFLSAERSGIFFWGGGEEIDAGLSNGDVHSALKVNRK